MCHRLTWSSHWHERCHPTTKGHQGHTYEATAWFQSGLIRGSYDWWRIYIYIWYIWKDKNMKYVAVLVLLLYGVFLYYVCGFIILKLYGCQNPFLCWSVKKKEMVWYNKWKVIYTPNKGNFFSFLNVDKPHLLRKKNQKKQQPFH